MRAQCGHGGRDGEERIHEPIPEGQLPACVRDVLNAARAARPEKKVTCIAFQTVEAGRLTARLGPEVAGAPGAGTPGNPSTIRAKDLLVLSVSVTETTFETVRTVTHVLVTLARPPGGPPAA